MSLLFVFLDGVGIGKSDAVSNPFMAARTPFLDSILKGKLTASLPFVQTQNFLFRAIDARLEHDGLPQSATGQTTLLTGINAAEHMKGHYGPWPGPTLKKELDKNTLFSELVAAGKTVQLANLYPPGFFEALESGKQKMNVPVYAAIKAGLELSDLDSYRQGKAISVDLTGEFLSRYGTYDQLKPFEMGQRLAVMAQGKDLTFFDYWPSDASGHRAPFNEAVLLIEKLDGFLGGIYAYLKDLTLIITSDHGNLEDKAVKTHTQAPVPLLVIGSGARYFSYAESILDVAPSVRQFFNLGESG